MQIRVSLDKEGFHGKPEKHTAKISSRIAAEIKCCGIDELAELVGVKGHTFCPAVFTKRRRRAENFKEMQVFALDFDNGVSYEKIVRISKDYGIPAAFAYHTFSSTQVSPRFRVVFVNDVRVTDRRAAELIIQMLLGIFEDADRSCKDVSRMFFGGKRLAGPVSGQTINILKLAESFQRKLFVKDEKNYSRAIRRFAKRNQIACVGEILRISRVHKDGKMEEKSGTDPYIYGSETVFPSDCPEYIIRNSYQGDVRENRKEREPRRMIRIQKPGLKKCRLYVDFLTKDHIHHNERFLLLSNLLWIEGGRRLFFAEISKKNYDRKKWRFYAKYIKEHGYRPQSCQGNCIYCEECHHKENMVLTVSERSRIRRIGPELFYEPAEDVYQYIGSCLREAAEEEQSGIYIIPAQTAIGKTESYCELIRNDSGRKYMIAVPTNCLKQEIRNRLEARGVHAEVTVSLDEAELPEELEKRIRKLYDLGLGRKVAKELRLYIREHEDSQDALSIRTAEVCRRYLSGEERIQASRVVITTHARLVTLSREMLQEFTVIIDEDILSTFFKNMRETWSEDLIKARDSGKCPRLLKSRIEEILAAPEKDCRRFVSDMETGYIPEEVLEALVISSNVNELSCAGSYIKENGRIRYFCPTMLPKGKYIVLSATLEPELYQKYFPGWYVKDFPYRRARYTGRLKQLTAHSMSRQYIQDHMDQIREIQRLFGGEKRNVITFLKYEKELSGLNLHYGNTEGVDSLKGQNMVLIGTPHQDEAVYRMAGVYLDIPVSRDTLAVRKVQYAGYEFSIMTYENEELRKLQFYFIRKELEQSIGRARLLRYDCTVVLFSNFPCEQAELIQEDYFENPEILTALQPVMAGR